MNPEFTAYQQSPHARVACAACHVGPGADWFVELQALRRVPGLLRDLQQVPAPDPHADPQPAPGAGDLRAVPLAGQVLRRAAATRIHYASDEANTRREINLLIKTGGGADRGLSHGHSLAHEHRQQGRVHRRPTSGGR